MAILIYKLVILLQNRQIRLFLMFIEKIITVYLFFTRSMITINNPLLPCDVIARQQGGVKQLLLELI